MPRQFHDRITLAQLEREAPGVPDVLRQRGLGRIKGMTGQERLQFSGMVRQPDGTITVFLPVSLKVATGSPALLMSALARFGHESPLRPFESEGDSGNCGLLSIIARLAEDFRAYGLFSDRQRIRGRDNGKPDWARTIKRERAFPGTDVFGTLHTTRWVDSRESLLTQVQAAVVAEIMEIHGWWLDGLTQHRGRLGNVPKPNRPRRLWPVLLTSLLPSLFSSRAIRLANWLINYLHETSGTGAGRFAFGIADFHTVWEEMLRETMRGVVPDINKSLPKAIYHPLDNEAGVEAPERSMLTDVVLCHQHSGVDHYTILDAKYYAARDRNTLPGWPDIAKQMFYEMALRSVVGKASAIRNCFVFPGGDNPQGGPYRRVDMRARDGKNAPDPVLGFPAIETVYLPIRTVMEAYRDGRQLDFPSSTDI